LENSHFFLKVYSAPDYLEIILNICLVAARHSGVITQLLVFLPILMMHSMKEIDGNCAIFP